ncbi:MAG: hypothetical protein PUI10_03460 [Prevotellaceae bacterium]|nr:hypothetical protein [Prevotellaceae bacterium]
MDRLFQIWQHLIVLYAEKHSIDVLLLQCISWAVLLPLVLLFYAGLSYCLLYARPVTVRKWKKGLVALWLIVTCTILMAMIVFVAGACG